MPLEIWENSRKSKPSHIIWNFQLGTTLFLKKTLQFCYINRVHTSACSGIGWNKMDPSLDNLKFLNLLDDHMCLYSEFFISIFVIRSDRISRRPRNPLFVCIYLCMLTHFPDSIKINPSDPRWRQVTPSDTKWTQVNPSEPKWTQVNQNVPKQQVRSS